MSKSLPDRPNIEHLKNEAKALKKTQSLNKLSEAQFLVAKDYGFPSWSKLKQHVEGYDDLRDEFFTAIRAGDKDRVQNVLTIAPGLVRAHDPNSFGQVPVAAAANRSDTGMIDLLLKAGADINARSDWWAGGFGALDFADGATSQHLLKKGATLTPHAAARLGMAKELRVMIAQDPSVINERGGDGQFPLHFAKTPEIVDILADAGANLDARDIDHESTAAQWRIKNQDVLQQLVDRGASTDIFMAVALDNPELIANHLQSDPGALTRKTNEPANTMIHNHAVGAPIYVYEIGYVSLLQLAANLGKERAFAFLFDKSPGPAKLAAAAWKGDRELALKYQDQIDKLDRHQAAQIADASRYRRHDLLQLMLELGFPVNTQDHEGMAPIHWAGFHGNSEAARLILPYLPDLELKNGYGGTALSTLCYGSVNGWYRDADFGTCAQLLIDAGAKVEAHFRGSSAVNEVVSKYQ